jgi:hypothetical protein
MSLFDLISGAGSQALPSAVANATGQMPLTNLQIPVSSDQSNNPVQTQNPVSQIVNNPDVNPYHPQGLLGRLLGIISPKAGQIADNFGDNFINGRHLANSQMLNEQAAMAGNGDPSQSFANNPMAALTKISQINPQLGAELRNQYIQSQFLGQQKEDAHNQAVQTYDDTRRAQAGRVMAIATPATYRGLYNQVQKSFGGTTDLSPLQLPDPSKVDPTANKFDDATQKAIDQAGIYNIPTYRMMNSNAATVAANARAQQAANGAALVPSEINRNNAQAGAAGVNAEANTGKSQAEQLNAAINLGKQMGLQPGQTIPGTKWVMPNGLAQGGVAAQKQRRPAPSSQTPQATPPPFDPKSNTGRVMKDPNSGKLWKSNGNTWISQ